MDPSFLSECIINTSYNSFTSSLPFLSTSECIFSSLLFCLPAVLFEGYLLDHFFRVPSNFMQAERNAEGGLGSYCSLKG